MRVLLALLVGLFLLPAAHAGDVPAVGNWKVTFYEDGQPHTYWLVLLQSKGGTLGGTVELLDKVPPTKLSDAQVTGDLLQFTLKLEQGPTFQFEGKLPKAGGKKMFGTLGRGARVIPAVLELTSARNSFELDREILVRTPNDPRVFRVVLGLIAEAKERKVPAKDVQEWLDTVMNTAENFGPRWQQELAVQLVDVVLATDGYAAVAVTAAQNALKLMDARAPVDARLRVLSALGTAFHKTGELDKAKEVEARLDKLEGQAYSDYEAKSLDFKVNAFAGRKSKSNRAVLVELFTGSQCPPCVAADLAFDAMAKAYESKDVVLLEYHLHVPGPDALTNADSEARAEFYGDSKIRGTPTVLFNGKVAPTEGGGREEAEERFGEYRKLAESLMDAPAGPQLRASATRKGDKVAIQATVRDLDNPGPRLKLRIALVEDWIRYKSRNGLSYFHHVVRAFPGGIGGVTLSKKDFEHSTSVDLDELRRDLAKYLDKAAKEAPFPDSQRPMRLRNLSVVAFVQNDATHEILQATRVAVKDE